MEDKIFEAIECDALATLKEILHLCMKQQVSAIRE